MAAEKCYRLVSGKLVKVAKRDPAKRYAMVLGPDGEPAYREYTAEENARRDDEEAAHAAKKAAPRSTKKSIEERLATLEARQ